MNEKETESLNWNQVHFWNWNLNQQSGSWSLEPEQEFLKKTRLEQGG
jgi:hypothetical protein